MEFSFYLGVDVSKNELDFSLQCGKERLFHKEIGNNVVAIKKFFKDLRSIPGFDLGKTLVCLEHTGIYSNHLLSFLHKSGANVWLESAMKIKQSQGLTRGKSDKIDAGRIALYAYEKKEHCRLWKPKREVVEKLAYFSTLRSALVETLKQIKVRFSDSKGFIAKGISTQAEKLCQRTITSLKADIAKVEKAIETLIKADEHLKKIFDQATSVCGVGPVTATQIIITTNEFEDIKDPKKFACYSGVAPFPHESGLYKGRSRVSQMANKKMKTCLHLAALTAIQIDPELKDYYLRRVEKDKKSKMLVINAIRNKLVLRIFACVNQNRKYDKSYIHKLA